MAVRRAAVFIGALLLGGCPSPKPAPRPAPAASSSASAAPTMELRADIGAECREKVLSLQDWLKSIEDAGLPLAMSLLDEGASLVARKGAAITDPAPLVHITVDSTFLDGVPVAGPEGLEKELTELIELRRSMMPESPFIQSPKSHLAIGSAVPWRRVAAAVAAMGKAGVEQVTFVFSDPDRTVPAPPPSPIDGELARMAKSAPVRRGQITAELVAFVYQDCPEGLRVIANMGVNPIADFKQVILDALPEAIGHCACAPDDASVKALHWALFGNPRPSSGVHGAHREPWLGGGPHPLDVGIRPLVRHLRRHRGGKRGGERRREPSAPRPGRRGARRTDGSSEQTRPRLAGLLTSSGAPVGRRGQWRGRGSFRLFPASSPSYSAKSWGARPELGRRGPS